MSKFFNSNSLLNFVCILKSGGDFHPDDVHALYCGVHRNLSIAHNFICLSDLKFDIPGVQVVPLERDLPGWWSVSESFRITGATIVTGLDTIIVDCIDRLGELALSCPVEEFYMTRPQPWSLVMGQKYCSGVMMWNGDWSRYTYSFKREYMSKFRGEQDYTSWMLDEEGVPVRLLQDYFDGFYSYKNDIRDKKVPADLSIAAFHGKPRPVDCPDRWLRDIYFDRTEPYHELAEMKKRNDGKQLSA